MLKRIFPLLLLILTTSCVEDVDFEQAEDLSISPVLEASLIFFDFSASQFQEPTGTAFVVEQDELELDFFNEEFIQDNLVKAEFFFEVRNTIDRVFRADVIMYDVNGNVTHMFDILVTAGATSEVTETHTEVFEDALLDQLKNTTRMELILTMFPSISGIPLDDTSIGTIKMRSKATLFFEIDTQ
ncbi:hypothetical protein [Kordia jejudonensis]|uniref:hypothetical protein n=1 Tax=Kordia jejudonensis TaxID=1348245 RepID=UPI000629764F|nr:hypothetical protein [Kordia jejudonensis]